MVTVTLRLETAVTLPFYHQPLIRALLYKLLGKHVPEHNGYSGLTFDAPESGQSCYEAGSYYRFTLIASGSAMHYLNVLFAKLQKLPMRTKGIAQQHGLFPDQISLHSITDVFNQQPVSHSHQLTAYGLSQLDNECVYWQQQNTVRALFISPTRIKRAKEDAQHLKGEQRFCRNTSSFSANLFWQRLHDSMAKLLNEDGITTPARQALQNSASFNSDQCHLFWADNQYGKHAKPVGGLLGEVTFSTLANLPIENLRMLVLGQYVGIGQQRSSGLGRYKLTDSKNQQSYPHYHSAQPLLLKALTDDNLLAAWQAVTSKKDNKPEEDDFFDIDTNNDEEITWQLSRLRDRILTGQYRPAPLRGVVIEKPQGGLRALAIPTFWERVIQRAVNQILAPALEDYYDEDSYGYRYGRSRINAKEEIEQAYNEGFHWVVEADIHAFFDSVSWQILKQKLNGLYRFDPLVNLLMDWISAPVDYNGYTVEREAGLPQGNPISPLLANLVLDEFDADIRAAGFKLVRYADDFVVLCKTEDYAQQAYQKIQRELAELGLSINKDKSGVVNFEKGFTFLGYLFVNSMVLDAKKHKDVTRAPKAPSGWLAYVWQHKPELLKKYQRALPNTLNTAEMPNFGSTLIITGAHATLSNKANQLQVTQNDEVQQSHPWSHLHAVLLIGHHHISTPALRAALKHNVSIHFAKATGEYEGCASSHQSALGQYFWAQQTAVLGNTDTALNLAKAIVGVRIYQQRETIRQRLDKTSYAPYKQSLDILLEQSKHAKDRQSLYGIEGAAAKAYFDYIRSAVPEWAGFSGRKRRPPPDPFNAILSLLYTVLYSVQHSILVTEGLHAGIGFYHQPRGAHFTLASDLMEPFRHLAERHALNAIGALDNQAFTQSDSGGCFLQADARRQLLATFWQKLDVCVKHKGETGSYLEQMQYQARRLIFKIKNDDKFIPFGVR